MMESHRRKLGRLSIFPLIIFLLFTLVTFTQTESQAADAPVWIDYDIHEQGVVEVKLHDGLPLETVNGRLTLTNNDGQQRGATALAESLQTLPAGNWTPVFDIADGTLTQLQRTASAQSGADLPDLALYFRVELPDGVDTAVAIAKFRASPLVAGAYPVDKPAPPPFPPDYETSNNSNFDPSLNLNIYQRYLDAAPIGMDVRYAWEGNGGRGAGIDVCDVEYGWNNHNELPTIPFVTPYAKIYQESYYDHGTAVLGMLGAKDNDWGTTGMVPDARLIFSPVTPITGSFNIANAISRCVTNLDAGDVILIEQQMGGKDGNFVPVEWNASTYAIIKTAVAAGITVVEAAGNGGEDLDDPFYQTAKPGHTPFTVANDSGAIIVGAANSPWTPDARTRADTSTYGSTVDLHGWGMHLIAPGYGDYYNEEGDFLSYTLFGGTSGASPMVTAAVTIVQANYKIKNGTPATPAQVKQLLRDTGTPQESVNGENIGPMPDLRNAINTLWNITEPNAPIITPANGTYSPPIQVTIDYGNASQNSSNTHIRYTLDGSEPTVDSYIYIPEQGDSIHLLYSATVRAKAFSSNGVAGRFFASPTTTRIYGLVAPKVSKPVISPNGGTYGQGQLVTISTSTSDATIKYRLDGRAPSFFYPGTTYSGPINLGQGTYHIVARAYKDGYYDSDVTYAEQLVINPITLPSPTIYPSSGQYSNEITVYIGSTVLGAQIRYTTNGAEPTQFSALYVDPISITSDTTVKARVFLDGYAPSASTTATYDIVTQLDKPSITSPSGNSANDSLTVQMSSSTPGASIRYTTNGAEPTSYSTLYSAPFNLGPGQHTVKARAFYNGILSQTETKTFTVYNTAVSVDPPTITPFGGIFNGPITVTMTSDTENTFLSYTLDATDPETSGTVIPYNGPFQLPGGATYNIRARAFLSGVGNSSMSSANVTVVTPTNEIVATPIISPTSGQYTNTVSVKVTAPDWSQFNVRKLYVTTDGTEPIVDFTSSGVGVQGVYNFNVSTPTTVNAISAQQGDQDSAVATSEFTFICDTPTITEGGTFTGSTNVTISTGTSNATIYYTTDGSEPTTSDNEYNGLFSVTSSQVVKAMCVRNNFEQSETAVSVFVITAAPVAPAITTQPQSTAAETCGSATFAVQATGTDPLTYTWYKDGNIIGGATEPELTLAAAVPADAGNYTVIVANEEGEVTSSTATLTVTGTDEKLCNAQPRVLTDGTQIITF